MQSNHDPSILFLRPPARPHPSCPNTLNLSLCTHFPSLPHQSGLLTQMSLNKPRNPMHPNCPHAHGSTLYVTRLLLATPTSLVTPSSFPTLQQDMPLKGGQAQALPMWQERECTKPSSGGTQQCFHCMRKYPSTSTVDRRIPRHKPAPTLHYGRGSGNASYDR